MSPTAPTFVTLNDRLNKAHRRIRELQARETELFAQNRILHAVITELIDKDTRIAAELCSSPLPTSPPHDGSDGRLGVGEHASQRPALAPTSGAGRTRDKTRRSLYV
ncbi:hypothetical protein [Mycobacterium sp. URHB0021]